MTSAPQLAPASGDAWQRLLHAVSGFARVRAVKSYRLPVPAPGRVPRLPCLDHEAMLHEDIAPHASLYVEDLDDGGLHEVVWVPARRRFEVDVVSTADEHGPQSHARLIERLGDCFPDHEIRIKGPSWLRGDRRVERACRAQISLREVLTGEDFEELTVALSRLEAIGSLMEKQSRVASWSVRTVTGPLLALVGFLSYAALGLLTAFVGVDWVQGLRYGVVGAAGAVFLYLGLKAVHLTEMANRVWKRSAEYGLILAERRRIAGLRPRPATRLPAAAAAARR